MKKSSKLRKLLNLQIKNPAYRWDFTLFNYWAVINNGMKTINAQPTIPIIEIIFEATLYFWFGCADKTRPIIPKIRPKKNKEIIETISALTFSSCWTLWCLTTSWLLVFCLFLTGWPHFCRHHHFHLVSFRNLRNTFIKSPLLK